MEITFYEYCKAKSLVLLYESENNGIKECKKQRNNIILIQHIVSTKLYNSIVSILDTKTECQSRRLNLGRRLYNINDLTYISFEDVAKCRNIGKKYLSEFKKVKSYAHNIV